MTICRRSGLCDHTKTCDPYHNPSLNTSFLMKYPAHSLAASSHMLRLKRPVPYCSMSEGFVVRCHAHPSTNGWARARYEVGNSARTTGFHAATARFSARGASQAKAGVEARKLDGAVLPAWHPHLGRGRRASFKRVKYVCTVRWAEF